MIETAACLMDTPPATPLIADWAPPEYLDIHYWDFAYEEKGPFRLYTADVGDLSAKNFANLLTGPLVDVVVGKVRREWSLHKALLTYHSTWFLQRINRGSAGKNKKIELFDLDPDVFELFVKWLYQGSIGNVSDMPMEEKWDHAFACQQLYLFCEEVGLPELKNLAIDQFRRACFQSGLVPGVEEMVPVYQKTKRSSPFRRLVSDIAARQIMDPDNGEDSSCYRDAFVDPDFAIDVIAAIKRGVGGSLFGDPTESDGCWYHEHTPGQHC